MQQQDYFEPKWALYASEPQLRCACSEQESVRSNMPVSVFIKSELEYLFVYPFEFSISARVRNAVPAGISADWRQSAIPKYGK